MRDDGDWDAIASPTPSTIFVPWSIRETATATFMVFAAFVAFIGILGFASLALSESQRISIAPWFAFASEAILLYVVWNYGVGKHATGWAILGFRRLTSLRFAWLAPAALAAGMVATGVYAAVTVPLELDWLLPQPIPEELLGGGAIQQTLIAVVLSTWVPFAEEIFFRGFLLQGIASRYGVARGVVFSALLFSVAHMTIATFIPIFLIGLILGLVYAKSRSLWIPMAAHSAQNLLAVIAGLVTTAS